MAPIAAGIAPSRRECWQACFRWSLIGYVGAEYAALGIPAPLLEPVRAALGGVVLVLALMLMPDASARRVPLGLVAAGLVVGLASPRPDQALIGGLYELSDVVALMTIMPAIGLVFEDRPYGAALLAVGPALARKPLLFNLAMSLFTHCVAALGSVSSLFIASEVLRQAAGANPRRLEAGGVAILRGYTLSFLWAPSAVPTLIAIHYTHAPLGKAMASGIAIAATAFLVQAALEGCRGRRRPILSGAGREAAATMEMASPFLPVSSTGDARRLMAEFFLILSAFLLGLLLLEPVTGLGIVHLAPLVAVMVAAIVSTLRSGPGRFMNFLCDYARNGILLRHKEIAIVHSAGFFAGALRISGLGQQAVAWLEGGLAPTGVDLVSLLALVIPVLAATGIPPVAALSMVVASIDSTVFAAAPVRYALLLLLGTMLGALFAPFSLPMIVLSRATGVPATALSLKANWMYGLVLLLLGRLLIGLMVSAP